MSTETRLKPIIFVVICLLAATAAGIVTARLVFSTDDVASDITLLEPPRQLPTLNLINDQAQAFGLEDLRGDWSLLFFGFTHCPDICPNTLGILNSVHATLKQDGDAPTLKIIFVSVDPRRDKPAALREYVRYFDKDFRGVTGEIEQIRRLTEALYLPFGYSDNPDGSYTVEHSSTLVLINPKAQARAYFTPPHDPQKLADDIKAVMSAK